MKMKAAGSGKWKSEDGRWLVIRGIPGRYDLYDLKKRKKEDQHVGMNRDSVADCEELARGFEWAERQEENPEAQAKLQGHK